MFERQGLYLTRVLSVDEWRTLGAVLRGRVEGALWQLGDWLVAGGRQHEVVGEGHYYLRGSVYDEAAAITGYDHSTLASAYSTAKLYPRGDRFPRLSFTHHRESLKVKDAEQRMVVMRRADEERWTRDQLSAYIEAQFPQQPREPKEKPRPVHLKRRTHVKCPQCAHVFEVRGHKVAQLNQTS